MKPFLSLVILPALAACTFAINDPEAFDRKAEKIVKTYSVSRDKLYACFMDNVGLTADDTSYSTGKVYSFRKPGMVEVAFEAPAPNKTTVISQAAPGGDWTISAKKYIAVTDKCATR